MTSPPPLPASATTKVSHKGFWTRALLILVVAILAFGAFLGYRVYQFIQYARDHPKKREAGYAEFRIANKSIIRNDGTVAKGNTPRAQLLAKQYSEHLAELRESFFTEGDDSTFSLSKGEMLTFCNLRDDSCAFLVHVPQLRRFTDDAKKSLVDLAWHSANTILKENGFPENIQLAVGVKGLMSYEGVLTGQLDTDTEPLNGVKIRESGFSGLKLLYPFFIPKNESRKADAGPADAPMPVVGPK